MPSERQIWSEWKRCVRSGVHVVLFVAYLSDNLSLLLQLEEKKRYLEHHWILAQKELDQEKALRSKLQDEVEGEGPIGALAACATACLPFMLRAVATGNYQDVSLDLFATISGSFGRSIGPNCHSVHATQNQTKRTRVLTKDNHHV